MLIAYDSYFFFRPEASKVERALALRAHLECLINLNMIYLKYHAAKGLYQSGVYYRRDPKGKISPWLPIPALYERGWGDCKSLATAYIAELRNRGLGAEPVFRFLPPFFKGTDHEYTLYHILVETDSGFQDVSKDLGMGWKDLKPFYQTDGSVESFDSAGMHALR